MLALPVETVDLHVLRDGKNVLSSSSACLDVLFVLKPSALVKGGILSNMLVFFGFRYFDALQIFALLAKNSSHDSSFVSEQHHGALCWRVLLVLVPVTVLLSCAAP